MQAFRLTMILCVFAVTVCHAGDLFSPEAGDQMYDFFWKEIGRTNKAITKPHLERIRTSDLRTFAGTYQLDYGDSGPSGTTLITIQGNRWSEKAQSTGIAGDGDWKLSRNKILLLCKRGADSTEDDYLRGFIVRLHGHWYCCDLDLPRGIAPLTEKP